jgi:hypothetical protein
MFVFATRALMVSFITFRFQVLRHVAWRNETHVYKQSRSLDRKHKLLAEHSGGNILLYNAH